MSIKFNRDMQDIIEMLYFVELIEHFKLFDSEVLKLLEVDARTLKRWKKDNSAPNWARKLIVIHGRGYLPPDAGWNDFKINKDGELVTPFKRFVLSPHDIMAWWYKTKRITTLELENERLRKKVERMNQLGVASNQSIFDKDGKIKQLKLL